LKAVTVNFAHKTSEISSHVSFFRPGIQISVSVDQNPSFSVLLITVYDSHVFGQPSKKEHGIENVKVTNSAWDTNVISASGVCHLFLSHCQAPAFGISNRPE
jgi:coronin-1B/1C/6